MRVTLAQLEAFDLIARIGTFHAAAERLNLTQPTVSLRIRALEQALGVTLFERRGRRARLTAEGADLVDRIQQLLNLSNELSGTSARVDPLRGRLRLGAPDSFALLCLPALLRSLEHDYPELKVALTVENSVVLTDMLNARDLDVSFLSEPEVDSHIRLELLGYQELAWVASPRLALPEDPARPCDLIGHHIVTNPKRSRLFNITQAWFAQAGVRPNRVSTCNNLPTIVRLTAAGAGISLLPVSIVRQEIRSRALRCFPSRPVVPPQRLYAGYQAGLFGRGMDALLRAARATLAQRRFLME